MNPDGSKAPGLDNVTPKTPSVGAQRRKASLNAVNVTETQDPKPGGDPRPDAVTTSSMTFDVPSVSGGRSVWTEDRRLWVKPSGSEGHRQEKPAREGSLRKPQGPRDADAGKVTFGLHQVGRRSEKNEEELTLEQEASSAQMNKSGARRKSWGRRKSEELLDILRGLQWKDKDSEQLVAKRQLLSAIKSRYSGTADYQVDPKNLLLRRFDDEASETAQLSRGVILCIVIISVCTLAAVLFAFMRRNVGVAPELKIVSQDLARACSSYNCMRSANLMQESMNLQADPCQNFYENVCGNWNLKSEVRPSYLEDQMTAYIRRVHDHLKRVRASTRLVTPDVLNMVSFYWSCIDFVTDRKTPTDVFHVLNALSIVTASWLNVKTFGDLLKEVVRTCKDTGLASFIAVFVRDSAVHVTTGTSLSQILAKSYIENREHFARQVAAHLKVTIKEPLWKVFELDDSVENAVRKSRRDLQVTEVAASDSVAAAIAVRWIDVMRFEAESPIENFSGESVILLYRQKWLSKVLLHVHSRNLKIASLYSLLVIASHLMTFFVSQDLGVKTTDQMRVCLCLVAETFDTVFPDWIANSLQHQNTSSKITPMVNSIKKTAGKMNVLSSQLQLDATYFEAIVVKIYGTSTKPRIIANSSFTRYSKDFPARFIAAAKARTDFGNSSHSTDAKRQLEGFPWSTSNDAIFILPTPFLMFDMFIQPDQQDLNFATLGTLLLEGWFLANAQRGSLWSTRAGQEYLRSEGREASVVIGKKITAPAVVKRLIAARWALDVAYQAWKTEHSGPTVKDESLERLFYRRFCHRSCGAFFGDRECNYAVSRSAEFARLYACEYEGTSSLQAAIYDVSFPARHSALPTPRS